jgi:hypothetical protein
MLPHRSPTWSQADLGEVGAQGEPDLPLCRMPIQVKWVFKVKQDALLQTSTIAMWVISTIATGEIWPVATVIVATDVVDISGS